MMVPVWVALVALVVAALWLYSRHRHNYWAARGVPSPPGKPFFGHLLEVMSFDPGRHIYDTEVYTKYGGSKLCGLYEFLTPILFTGDLDIMKHIFIKDFDYFSDRRKMKFSKKDQVMNDMLSIKNGPEWKVLRAIMSPVFTSGKIKNMFPIVCEKGDLLVSYSLQQATEKKIVDMKDCFGRFTMDVIATCAFGIEASSFNAQASKFADKAEQFFSMTALKALRSMMIVFLPRLSNLLGLSFSGPELDFFHRIVKEAISLRKKGESRGDFLDLLLEAQETAPSADNTLIKKVMTDDCIVSQCVLFLVAGFDTTASTLSFCSYELAKNVREQQRLREELRALLKENNGELTLQALTNAKFLDSCINETLRMYPPLVLTERCCTKPYHLPGTSLDLKAGDLIQVPIWCVHHDPQYWPEPDCFRPDRFMPDNKASIKSCTFMPFGLGPRNCLAMRFALLEVRVALAKMVLAAELRLAEGQEKLELCMGGGVIRPKNGVKVLLQPLPPTVVG